MSEYLSLWPWRGPLLRASPHNPHNKRGSIGELWRIAQYVAAKHGLTTEDLRGPSVAHAISHPRQEAMADAYATGQFSTIRIGKFFGGRDHKTVSHAIKAHEARALAQQEAA